MLQIEKTRWRDTLAGATVVVHEHLDGRLSIRYGGEEHHGSPKAGSPLKDTRKEALFKLEALPPDLRDLSLWAGIVWVGSKLLPAPAIPALSRRSSCFPAALDPPLRVRID